MREDLAEGHSIEHLVLRHAALARDSDAPFHEIELGDRVRVGIDAEQAAQGERPFMPAPIQIEPVGLGIDLDGNAVCGALLTCGRVMPIGYPAKMPSRSEQ